MAEQKTLHVSLIRYTYDPEETISLGAKLCYSGSTIPDLKTKWNPKISPLLFADCWKWVMNPYSNMLRLHLALKVSAVYFLLN